MAQFGGVGGFSMARVEKIIFLGVEKKFLSLVKQYISNEESFCIGVAKARGLSIGDYFSSELDEYVKKYRKTKTGKVIKFLDSILNLFSIINDLLNPILDPIFGKRKKFCQNFRVLMKEWTALDYEFFYELQGSFYMVDIKAFRKAKIFEEESRNKLITDYIKQVFEPFMSDYIWNFDNKKLFLYRKMGKGEEKGKRVIFDRDLKDQLEAIKFCRQGCEIKDISIKYASDDESRKVEEMLENTVKPLKNPKLNEGEKNNFEYKTNNEKVYNAKGIKIKTIFLNNGLRIGWKNQDQIRGTLKIYREEGNFSEDKYSINGLLIADSELRRGEKGETLDYIEKEKDYYYTINYEVKRPKNALEALNEVGGKGILDFCSKAVKLSETIEETESGSSFLHICRFSVRLPKEEAIEPKQQPQQPKTMIDRINEKNKKITKIRETITELLQKNLKAIEEEGKIRGLTAQEIEEKKDLERARLAKIEMEEIEKLERKYR